MERSTTTSRGQRQAAGSLVWLCLVVGCAAEQPNFHRALMHEPGGRAQSQVVQDHYVVQCPDVLELRVAGRRELTGQRPVGPDGRIDLGRLGQLRAEGQTLPELRRVLAEVSQEDIDNVNVGVAEFRSQFVYLYGQVSGLQRAVPYRGQETVLDMLQRAGGITPNAASNEVYVVRPHVDAGRMPEVFKIDLRAIVNKNDQRTNVRIMPYDEIHIGETRKFSLDKCVPLFLQPSFEVCCALVRHVSTRREEKQKLRGRHFFKPKEPKEGEALPAPKKEN